MLSINNVCKVLHITRQPNSMIVLLFIENISKFLTSSWAFFKTFACFSAQFQIMNRCFFLADTPQKPDEVHQAMFFEYPCTNSAFCFSQQLGYFCLWTAMNSFAIFLSFALMSKQTGCHCCLKTIRLWLYIGNMQPYLLCVCPHQNILNELTLPVPKPYTIFRVPLYYKEFKWEVYDGCPMLQQIYAWQLYCIVFTLQYCTKA